MSRVRCVCLKAYLTPEEYEFVVDFSGRCGLSISEMTRRVLLGQEISSKVDRQALLDILKVNADLGRLGGLLKLWLSDDVKSFGLSRDVRPVLREVEKRQAEMKPLIEALRKSI